MFIPIISQNQNKNTFNKDIYKKFRKKFQDPTRDLLEPIEFIRWCYFKLETLKFFNIEI